MIFDLITIVLVGLVLAFAGFTALQLLGKFPTRTRDDVPPYLRPAELEELEALLDPAQEVNFRLRLSPREFRAWQRKRIHLMREYLLRMSHNALVLVEWGNMELAQGNFAADNLSPRSAGSDASLPPQRDQERQALAQELVQAATEFRLYSLLALLKLKLWIVFRMDHWPLLPSPSLPRLRNVFGIDAVSSYHRLKSSAGSLGMAYGYEYHRELLGRL
ncbi:MAG: hypothetical protein LAO20_19595 [Acidobacteriia bacterium]|nr:hypothetical protein [Terriglobia bacterium]